MIGNHLSRTRATATTKGFSAVEPSSNPIGATPSTPQGKAQDPASEANRLRGRGNSTDAVVVRNNALLSPPTSSAAVAPAQHPVGGQIIALSDGAKYQRVNPGTFSAALDSNQMHIAPAMPKFVPPPRPAPINLPAPEMTHLEAARVLLSLSSTRTPVTQKQSSPPSENISVEESTKNLKLLAEVSSWMEYAPDAGPSTAKPPTLRPQAAQNVAGSSTGIQSREMDQTLSSIAVAQEVKAAPAQYSPSSAFKNQPSFHGALGPRGITQPERFLPSPFSSKQITGSSLTDAARSLLSIHAGKDRKPDSTNGAEKGLSSTTLHLDQIGASDNSEDIDEDMVIDEDVEMSGSVTDGTDGDEEMEDNLLEAGPDPEDFIRAEGKDEIQFHCLWQGCDLKFARKWDCKQHIKGVHLKLRPHKCPYVDCGSRFGTKGSLTKHIRSVHEKLRPFKCMHPGCGMAFGEKGNLNKHIQRKHQD